MSRFMDWASAVNSARGTKWYAGAPSMQFSYRSETAAVPPMDLKASRGPVKLLSS
jgi:hypothetical protein